MPRALSRPDPDCILCLQRRPERGVGTPGSIFLPRLTGNKTWCGGERTLSLAAFLMKDFGKIGGSKPLSSPSLLRRRVRRSGALIKKARKYSDEIHFWTPSGSVMKRKPRHVSRPATPRRHAPTHCGRSSPPASDLLASRQGSSVNGVREFSWLRAVNPMGCGKKARIS